MKEREAAHAILSVIGSGRFVSLASYARTMRDSEGSGPAILDVAYSSRFAKQLGQLPGYTQGYFWPTGEAKANRAGVELPYVDLQRTEFSDATFDIILTHDALPFIEDIDLALAETARILRPGGACISIAKIDWPLPAVTEDQPQEADTRMYNTPDGGSMAMRRKLGADLADRMRQKGLRPIFRRMSFHLEQRRNFTVIGVKA